ncbi:MAG: tetratricopeptide repeat protein [Bryobacteraceae bacterium]|jgi:hypothetical protein
MALKRINSISACKLPIGVLLIAWALPAFGDIAAAEHAYQNGDYSTAFKEFLPLAEQGSARAQFRVAYMYDVGKGVARNSEQAVRWYRAAAANGEAAAQYNLGLMLANGEGVAKDYDEAAKWFRSAASQGDSMAQYELGLLYFSGNGVPMNYAEWLKWLQSSARQGYLAAQKELGFWLDFGCRMKRLPKYSIDSKNQSLTCGSSEAAKWYRLAAQQGDAGSQRELGQMCLEGRGVPQSDTEALKWLHMAADQGEADAQLSLARMYKDGRGVPQDFITAVQISGLTAGRGEGCRWRPAGD